MRFPLIGFVTGLFLVGTIGAVAHGYSEPPEESVATIGLDLHAPIFIEGNDDFTASNGVSGGSGTPADPYILSGLEINAASSPGVHIRETSASFVIQNLTIRSSGRVNHGIHLDGVRNGKVEGVQISTSLNGIHVFNSTNISLSDTEVTSSVENGISLLSASDVDIFRNFVDGAIGVDVRVQSSTNVSVWSNNLVSRTVPWIPSYRDQGILLWSAFNVSIFNNSITGHSDEGIWVYKSGNVSITENQLSGNRDGINAFYADNVTASGNDVSFSEDDGIQFAQLTNGSIIGNRITESGSNGVDLWRTPRVVVRDNVISSSGWAGISMTRGSAVLENNTISSSGIAGIELSYAHGSAINGNDISSGGLLFRYPITSSYFDTLEIGADNRVNDKPLHYYNGCSGLEIDGIPVGQLVIVNCTRVRVANLRISDTTAAITLFSVTDALIAGNEVYRNRWAGIELIQVKDVVVTGNTVVLNGFAGLRLFGSANAALIGNNVTYNGGPVWPRAQNRPGIEFDIALRSRVHGNNIIQNSVQALDSRTSNNWDDGYPSGGNFWSDYSGADRCSGPSQDICPSPDGIGDAPYELDTNVDRYPWMVPLGLANTPPQAHLGVVPAFGTPTTVFTIDGSQSVDAQDPSDMLVYRWDWEGDGQWDTDWSFSPTVERRYVGWGNFTTRMEVRDSRGAIDRAEVRLFVENSPPVAQFAVGPSAGDTATTYQFDASTSFDLSDPPDSLQVRWDWEDDGAWDTPWSGARTETHRYQDPGSYVVRLEVRDPGGLSDQTKRELVVLEDRPPVAVFDVTPSTKEFGRTFLIDASESSDPGNASAVLRFRWDWEDDGAWDTNYSTRDVVTHRFTRPGTFVIRLEVLDPGGLTNQTTRSVVVLDVTSPVIQHTPPTGARVDETVTVSVLVTDEGSLDRVHLLYRDDPDSRFTVIRMTSVGGDRYEAGLPQFSSSVLVEYYFRAVDESGNVGESQRFSFPVSGQLSPVSMGVVVLIGVAVVVFISVLIRNLRPPSRPRRP